MREGKLRKSLAVILGVVVGNVIFFLVSIVSDRIYPTPPELLNPQTPEATALRVTTAEVNGLLLVLLGSALGAFFGGIIGAAIAKGKIVAVTSAIGGLLSPWAFYSFYVFLSSKTLVSYRYANRFPRFLLSWRSCSNAISKREDRL